MRERYNQQLELIHTNLIHMGALCEEAIASAVDALFGGDASFRKKTVELEIEIDQQEREIEILCERLVLREQPVARDLRRIIAAQKMIVDMERVGDQAADIAGLSVYITEAGLRSDTHISDMAKEATHMLTESIDAFVTQDIAKAREVIASDDIVDGLFNEVKQELVLLISRDNSKGSFALDLLMVAKYLERIADHAVNIAEWVVFSVSGERKGED